MQVFRSILLAVTRQHTTDMELRQAFRLVLDNRATLLIALFDQSLERNGPQKLDSAISASSGQAAILAADS